MEKLYAAVLAAQEAAIAALLPGKPLSSVYRAAVGALKAQVSDDLAAKLGKSIGFAMGLQLRESKLQLTASSDIQLEPLMIFNVSVGLSGLENAAAESAKSKCVLCSCCPVDNKIPLPLILFMPLILFNIRWSHSGSSMSASAPLD
jgi:nucleosome binding factor SPN SPT16 subunit